MKKIIFLITLCISSVSFSQTLNTNENGYYKIFKTDSLSRKEIHDRAMEWIALNYKSANDVIQLDSEDKIIVKGNFDVYYNNYKQVYYHTLIIAVKDYKFKVDVILNSFRVDISNLKVDVQNGYLSTNKEEIFERFQNDPRLTEDYQKKEMIDEFVKSGLSEKRAIKEWEKSKKDIMSSIPKTIDDVDMKPILMNAHKIKEKVSNIFDSIELYVNKSKSDDEW